jgi:hypothetical protein
MCARSYIDRAANASADERAKRDCVGLGLLVTAPYVKMPVEPISTEAQR